MLSLPETLPNLTCINTFLDNCSCNDGLRLAWAVLYLQLLPVEALCRFLEQKGRHSEILFIGTEEKVRITESSFDGNEVNYTNRKN